MLTYLMVYKFVRLLGVKRVFGRCLETPDYNVDIYGVE